MDPCRHIEGEEILRAEGQFGPFVGAASDTVVHGTYRQTGTWSQALHDLLAGRLLRGGGTLIDVGANIGLVSIPVVEKCGAKVLAFEPDPRNAELLSRNVALHKVAEQVEVHRVAAWSSAATLRLSRDPANHGDHRLEQAGPPGAGPGEVLEVAAVPLDSRLDFSTLPRPVVAKLDTQGAEVDVLLGAQHSLRHFDHLICEIWPFGLQRLGRTLEELVDLLASEFAWAKLLLQGEAIAPLPEIRPEFARLGNVPDLDGADTFFDALISRERELETTA